MIQEQQSTTDPEQTTAVVPPNAKWSNIIMTLRMLALFGSGFVVLLRLLSKHQIAEAWAWLQSPAGSNWGATFVQFGMPVALSWYALFKNTKLHSWLAGLVKDDRVADDVVQIKGAQK